MATGAVSPRWGPSHAAAAGVSESQTGVGVAHSAAPVTRVDDVHQVVVVVPVDRDEDEAEEIDGEFRNERPEIVQAVCR